MAVTFFDMDDLVLVFFVAAGFVDVDGLCHKTWRYHRGGRTRRVQYRPALNRTIVIESDKAFRDFLCRFAYNGGDVTHKWGGNVRVIFWQKDTNFVPDLGRNIDSTAAVDNDEAVSSSAQPAENWNRRRSTRFANDTLLPAKFGSTACR